MRIVPHTGTAYEVFRVPKVDNHSSAVSVGVATLVLCNVLLPRPPTVAFTFSAAVSQAEYYSSLALEPFPELVVS